jgi:Uncharacterized conserved protein
MNLSSLFSIRGNTATLDFSSLSEQQLLALAISLEEDDARIYSQYALAVSADYPDTAALFRGMAAEENTHRHRLLDLYRKRFGDRIPLIRRQDVRGFIERKPLWLVQPIDLEKFRAQAEVMEAESRMFYAKAARHATDTGIRQLLGDLAAAEAATSRKPKRSATSSSRRKPYAPSARRSAAPFCCASFSPAWRG